MSHLLNYYIQFVTYEAGRILLRNNIMQILNAKVIIVYTSAGICSRFIQKNISRVSKWRAGVTRQVYTALWLYHPRRSPPPRGDAAAAALLPGCSPSSSPASCTLLPLHPSWFPPSFALNNFCSFYFSFYSAFYPLHISLSLKQ